MPIHRLILAFLLAACLAPSVSAAEAVPGRPSPELAVLPLRAADARFLLAAVAAGTIEVRAGELALRRSRDQAVRELADRMVQDRRDANLRLLRIARDRGVSVPRAPSPAQRELLAALRDLRGEAFDRAFLQRAGIAAHRDGIALFQGLLRRPDPDPALKSFASETLPTLEQHLRMAEAALARQDGDKDAGAAAARDAAHAALEQIADAAQVLRRMKDDPGAAALLREANGVLVLPHYGRAALGVGVRGGEGVLVTRHGDRVSDPAFFRLGGLSLGLQAGAASGDVVYLLMSDRAVQKFRSTRRFSLAADGGFTIGRFSQRRHASQGKLDDVVVWTDTRGAYAGASVGLSEVVPDDAANRAYYGRAENPSEILGGLVANPHPNVLAMVLRL